MHEEDWDYEWAVRETNTYIVYYQGRRQFEITLDADDRKLLDAMIDRMNGIIPQNMDPSDGLDPLQPTIDNWDSRMYR